MASLALSSSSTTLRLSSLGFRSLPSISFLRSRRSLARAASPHGRRRPLLVRALTLDFTGSFFEEGGDEEGDGRSSGPSAAAAAAVMEDKEEPQCPPGLRQYESMAVLRPDMTEDERLALIQRYEELLVAGGGMYMEVFNRGVIPLAYSIKKKNKAGETNTYLDGIYILFTFFTKPESIIVLETRLKADDDVIRSSTFKIRKRKY
ncbi:30S ribosomal protein S6 alpha, chloroplastic [Ananas comosus]|uniref:30S ribosomal protein S6 alpha, chloroplastic n=1 Tax=Ananas comosus TaxID=4615 RepID=A0A199VE64_ANACO|nr:30S ribosomal protein S6 alpha, chloroplastic [Ananas comosus]OAY75407.1 30S ribosomal protein S6 alpha, chloroplastic [Ananas comosus]